MKTETWKLLEDEFTHAPTDRATSVPYPEIHEASRQLGCSFHDDFVEFVHRFGGAMVGAYPIFGLRQPDGMGDPWSVIDVTNWYRKDGWPGVAEWYIISADAFGNPYGVSSDGKVWISDHDVGEISLVALSFDHFLRSLCLPTT